MEEQQEKSKWDELARQLGAEPRPEPEQPTVLQQTPVRVPDTSTESVYAASLTPPKRPPAGWDLLASEFGLPTPDPDAAPEANQDSVPATPVRTVPPEAATEPTESAPPQRRGRRGGPRDRRDDESPERPRGNAHAQRESRPRERHDSRPRERNVDEPRERREERPRERPKQRREPRRGRSAPRIEAESPRPDEPMVQSAAPEIEASAPTSVPSTKDVAPVTQPAKPSAVSLWHKIFGLPADLASAPEPAATVAEETGDDLLSVSGPPPLHDTSAVHLADEATSDIDAAADREAERDEEEVAKNDDSESSRRPTRRRRRGRGGRGRRGSSEQGEPQIRSRRGRAAASAERPGVHDKDQEGKDQDEQFDEVEEIAADDDFSDSDEPSLGDELMDGIDEEQFSTSRGKSAMQRSIPSWEETIGHIVETNMQSRSQRRPSGPSGSRSSSRGRPPRGRRRS